MLTPEQLDQFPDNLVTLYGKLEADIIADISRRLARYDYFIPSAEFQYKKALEMGNIHDEILKKMESLTGKRKREIEQLMKEAGYQTIKVDDEIYQLAGLKPKPISQSPALLSVLNAGINNTNGLFENLTRTTARTTTKQFERALDRAYMQITSGAFDYETAIRGAVKSLSEKGIASIEYPSGKISYLESAVRRAALTGVNQTALKLQETRADEVGCDLVETSAHEGARPSHEVWQGKIFSRSGNHPKYPNFREVTGYGTGAGLGGYNCRHNFYPFFEGISKRAYTDKELNNMQAQNYEYNGKKMTEYEATQKQRYIESQIRRWKREYNGMNAAGLPTAEASAKISRWNNTHDDFLRQTGLKRQSGRLQVGKKVDVSGRNGIIVPRGNNAMRVDVEVDDFTPCLIEKSTGKIVHTRTVAVDLKKSDYEGWKFDWSIPKKNGYEIHALKTTENEDIQGLIASVIDKANKAVHVDIIESSPHNFGKTGIFDGVGAHLFAYACKQARYEGYDYVYFDAKTKLIEYYKSKLGAMQIGSSQRMLIEGESFEKLIQTYYGGEKHE